MDDEKTLLLEFLKYQWEERRHHQTAEINATAFLTGAAGIVLGFAFKDAQSNIITVASGFIVFLIGVANFRINRAYFLANRFRNSMGWNTRLTLEKAIKNWSVETPTEIREMVKERDISLGGRIHGALMSIPIATMLAGIAVIASSVAPEKFKFLGVFAT